MINCLYKGCLGLILFYSYILFVGLSNFVGQVTFVSNILYQVSSGIVNFCGTSLVIILVLFYIILMGPFLAIIDYLNTLYFIKIILEKLYICKLLQVILLHIRVLYIQCIIFMSLVDK